MNMNQITLPVKNIQAANAFYRKLGFTQIVDSPEYARFECPVGGATLSLSLDADDYRNGAVIYFESERLDAWVTELQAKGVEFSKLPTDMPYLWREAELFDPSGNKIKLYFAGENRLNPPWRVQIRD